MAHDRAFAKLIPVVHRPTEFVNERRQHERRVGDAARDDHVRTVAQCFYHRLRSKIRVGGNELGPERSHRLACLLDLNPRRFHCFENVVASNRGDLQVAQSQRVCDFTNLVRARDRIGGAHVGQDLDSLCRTDSEHGLHSIDQQRVIAERSIAHLRLLRDGDRALGQALEDEVLDAAIFRQLDGRLDAVAGIAGACSNSDALH